MVVRYCLNIRDIQHYMYCPRRFALLCLNRDWNENAFVVKANLLHERVHDGSHEFSDKKKIVRSAVTLYNDLPEYDIFGVTDCVEFFRDKNGVGIEGLEGSCGVRLVEYKPKAPKGFDFNETDAIQVFAQKLCADFVWGCDLVEESRCIIERLVLTMINLKKLNKKDFEMQESGAVYQTKDGKKKVLTAWQEKKRTTIAHPYINEKIPLGLLPFVQSSLLAKFIRGETVEYQCFLLK